MKQKEIIVTTQNKPSISCLSETEQKSLALTLLARVLKLRAEKFEVDDGDTGNV